MAHTPRPIQWFVDKIRALCEQGQLDHALSVVSSMDAPPSNHMYTCLLRACNRKKALNETRLIYAHLAQHRVQLTGLLGDYLVVTLARCGGMEDAHAVFFSLPCRTVFSWTAMISGFCEQGLGHEALNMYEYMQEDSIEPNSYTMVSLSKACGCIRDLKEAKRIHADAWSKGFFSDVFLSNTLIRMYGKCGDIVEAENVFQGLDGRDVISWNAMLTAYVELGQGEKALLLYNQMRDGYESPDSQTFLAALQACIALAEKICSTVVAAAQAMPLVVGRGLHADARREGFSVDGFVSNTLVCLYGKCGCIVEAENVFVGLPQPSPVSWNVMLSGYVEQGQGESSLQLYGQMLKEGASSDQMTFTITFQACSSLIDREDVELERTRLRMLNIAQALHVDAQWKRFDSNVFVGNTILSMYGKCASIVDAENVFQNLSQRNPVSWNAMLSAYAQQDQGVKALWLYRQMQEELVNADSQTLVAVLQACGVFMEEGTNDENWQLIQDTPLEIGLGLHADARRRGLMSDAYVATALVSVYGKCGSIIEAESVFDGLSGQRDAVAWNAMMSAYVEQAQNSKALQLSVQMQHEGMCANQQTFVIALQACGAFGEMEEAILMDGLETKRISLGIGMALDNNAREKNLMSAPSIGNTLISMYGKCGSIASAESAFSGLCHRSIISWNAMLSAYIDQGQGGKGLLLYRQMQEEGVGSVQQTLAMALQAVDLLEKEKAILVDGQLSNGMPLEIIRALHADAFRKGLQSDAFVGNMLVKLYGKYGSIVEAKNAFEGLSQHNIVSRNVLLSAYVDHGQGERALDLYLQMQYECSCMDEFTFVTVLQSCSETGSLDMCMQVHFGIVFAGHDGLDLLRNSLVHAYGSCASMADAQTVFDGWSQPDLVGMNACITGYAKEGNCDACVQIFEELQLASMKADQVTFLSVLAACNHAGLVDKGILCFESMCQAHGLTLALRHYAAIIDLIGRAGDLEKVENILWGMPFQANLTVWLCVLGMCRTHGNIELGKEAFDSAVSLQSEQSTAYILMSNIYVDAGMYDFALEVENLRKKERTPDGSCIEFASELEILGTKDVAWSKLDCTWVNHSWVEY